MMRYIQTERRIKLNNLTRTNKVGSKKKMWILISVIVAALLIVSGIVSVVLYKKWKTESVEEKVNNDGIKIENQAIDQNKTPDEKGAEIKTENQTTVNPQKNKEESQTHDSSSSQKNESSSSEKQESEDSSENYSLWTENHQRENIKTFTDKVKKMVEYLKTIEKDKCIADLKMTSDMYDIFDFTLENDQLVSVKCKKELTKSTNKNFTTTVFKFMKYNMLKYIIGDRFAEYFTGKYKDTESYHSFFNDNKNFNLEMSESEIDVDVDYLELINIISTLWDKNNNMNSVKDVIKSNKSMNSRTLTMNVDAEMKKVMENKKQGKEAEEENGEGNGGTGNNDEEESEESKLKKEEEKERRRSERQRINAEKAKKQQEARDRKKSLRAQKKGK